MAAPASADAVHDVPGQPLVSAAPLPAAPALAAARAQFHGLGAQLLARGLAFRPPPPEPTSCCGRGCNGCVWESFYGAADHWCDEAQSLLAALA